MRITESKLRRIIRQVIRESNESGSIASYMNSLGIVDDQTLLQTMDEHMQESRSPSNPGYNANLRNRSIHQTKKIEKKIRELEQKVKSLHPNEKKEVLELLVQIEATKDVQFINNVKMIAHIIGATAAATPLLVAIFGSFFGLEANYLRQTFPLLFNDMSMGASFISVLFGFSGLTGESQFYLDVRDENREEIERLERRLIHIKTHDNY